MRKRHQERFILAKPTVGMLQRGLHIELLCPCPRSLENGGWWEQAPHLTHGQTGVGWCPVRELRLTGVVDVLLMAIETALDRRGVF